MKKHRRIWIGALALGLMVLSTLQTLAVTNGLVLITTRTAHDALWRQISSSSLWDADDYKGPGIFSPGDVTMATLLQDHGYSPRLVPEWILRLDAFDPYGTYVNLNPEYYYGGGGGPTRPNDTNYLMSAQLIIVSGSGSSADMPQVNTNGIPIIMGEHSCVGDAVRNGHSSIYMYKDVRSGDISGSTFPPANPDVLYMKVTAAGKAHPILQGIPLDDQDRIKIWRDPYPEENAHVPTGGKPNWRYLWLTVNLDPSLAPPATPAAGTTILGRLASDTNRAVFAVMEAGGELAPLDNDPSHPWYGRTTAPSRLVHWFVNEDGSGGSRRAFNCLTDIGKVIFIRTCKWAMGEALQPYQPLGIIRVSALNATQIKLEWDGLASKSYKVLGSADLFAHPTAWQTIAQDIPGVNGTVSATLDISGAPQYAFLRVMPAP